MKQTSFYFVDYEICPIPKKISMDDAYKLVWKYLVFPKDEWSDLLKTPLVAKKLSEYKFLWSEKSSAEEVE